MAASTIILLKWNWINQMETKLLTANDIETAAAVLRDGGLLGIPTETVYGLGADGLNPDAVRRIFEAKGRPQDNPLNSGETNTAVCTRFRSCSFSIKCSQTRIPS